MTIFQDTHPVALIGGADLPSGALEDALALAQHLVAADGGGDQALARGLLPEAVIGDLDSLSDAARSRMADRLHPIAEQDSTDFDKALRNIDAPLVIAVGFTGGRFDHELAAMNVLARHPDRPCVILGSESLVFLTPPEVTIDLPPRSDIGLFPLARSRIASRGLVWPTEGMEFSPTGQIATSNLAKGPVHLVPAGPEWLTILPRERLRAVVTALIGPPSAAPRWPARAR